MVRKATPVSGRRDAEPCTIGREKQESRQPSPYHNQDRLCLRHCGGRCFDLRLPAPSPQRACIEESVVKGVEGHIFPPAELTHITESLN